MRYMMLIYESPRDIEGRDQASSASYLAAWRAYHAALVKAGAHVGGAPLKGTATATTLRLKNGRRDVQDGPYAESKEELGGFILVDLPSMDAALDWASRCPAAATGAVEIRPLDIEFHDTVLET